MRCGCQITPQDHYSTHTLTDQVKQLKTHAYTTTLPTYITASLQLAVFAQGIAHKTAVLWLVEVEMQ